MTDCVSLLLIVHDRVCDIDTKSTEPSV